MAITPCALGRRPSKNIHIYLFLIYPQGIKNPEHKVGAVLALSQILK